MEWTPAELAAAAQGRLIRSGSAPISGVFLDSRTPLVGGLFVPIVAARDGHDFIDAAVTGGAAAVLVAAGQPVPTGPATVVEVADTLVALTALARNRRARFDGPVVSISGSNGKTTTRSMVAAVLATGFDPVLCTQGNLNNHLGVPLTLLGRPHAPKAMVLELGMSAPGENDHLAGIVGPNAHVITSVGLEHLEFMKTIEAIAAAEAEPVAHLASGDLLVLPSDERRLDPHRPASGPKVMTFGPDVDATIRILATQVGERTVATLEESGGKPFEVRLRLFGEHNARNAAAAIAVGRHFGLPLRAMIEALESVDPVGDRGRVQWWGPHLVVADCYNANPGSVEVALRSLAALRATCQGPLVAVLGDMLELGPTENALHAQMGKLAAELGISAVLGFGPRSALTVDAAAGSMRAVHCSTIDELAEQLAEIFGGTPPGGVLIKGSRGMRLERLAESLR